MARELEIHEFELEGLRSASYDGSIPALLEALIYCAQRNGTTPKWVSGMARDLLIELMAGEKKGPRGRGASHLDRCRLDLMHFRRYDLVEEILRIQSEFWERPPLLRASIERFRSKRGDLSKQEKDTLKNWEDDLEWTQHLLKALGRTLNSACDVAARLLPHQGDLGAGPSAVLKSYKMVQREELSGRFYYPHNRAVVWALGLVDLYAPKPTDPEFEKDLFGAHFLKKRKLPARRKRKLQRPQGKLPWALERTEKALLEGNDRSLATKRAVLAGNLLALVDQLHWFASQSGHAPAWLMKSAAGEIIRLLELRAGAGRRVNIMREYEKRLINMQRYELIRTIWLSRSLPAGATRRALREVQATRRFTYAYLKDMDLLRADSVDEAIRKALKVVDGTPLGTSFEAAKKAFYRLRNDPKERLRHHRPSPYLLQRLGMRLS